MTCVQPCCPQACGPNILTGLCCNSLPCCSISCSPCCSTFCAEQPPPPIDPVSLAIALQAQKENIREEKLNFGPNRLPLEGRIICCPINVLEDGLHTLNNDIVELKPCCPRKTIAEEAAESYLEDDLCDIDCCCKPILTYSDLGYVRETPKCAEFVPGAPPTSSPQGQVIYCGPAIAQQQPTTCVCQQVPTCLSQPPIPECVSNVYQPGGLYLTQIGCRNAACSPELPCACQNLPCNCVQQCCHCC